MYGKVIFYRKIEFKKERSNQDNIMSMCSVCLEEIVNGENIHYLECKHSFHYTCFIDLIDNHHMNCPVCRKVFVVPYHIRWSLFCTCALWYTAIIIWRIVLITMFSIPIFGLLYFCPLIIFSFISGFILSLFVIRILFAPLPSIRTRS